MLRSHGGPISPLRRRPWPSRFYDKLTNGVVGPSASRVGVLYGVHQTERVSIAVCHLLLRKVGCANNGANIQYLSSFSFRYQVPTSGEYTNNRSCTSTMDKQSPRWGDQVESMPYRGRTMSCVLFSTLLINRGRQRTSAATYCKQKERVMFLLLRTAVTPGVVKTIFLPH